jgi:hypothetical protein
VAGSYSSLETSPRACRRRRRFAGRDFVGLGALVGYQVGFPHEAGACPNCAIGRQAWFAVLHQHFGLNLFLTALPFVIVWALSQAAARLTQSKR